MKKVILALVLCLILCGCAMAEETLELNGTDTSLYIDAFEGFVISNPTYICPLHGEMDSYSAVFRFDFEEEEYTHLNNAFCAYCFAEFLMNNLPTMELKDE